MSKIREAIAAELFEAASIAMESDSKSVVGFGQILVKRAANVYNGAKLLKLHKEDHDFMIKCFKAFSKIDKEIQ